VQVLTYIERKKSRRVHETLSDADAAVACQDFVSPFEWHLTISTIGEK